MKPKDIHVATARNHFRYEPKTGKIFWRKRTKNTYPNSEAGYIHRNGYIKIKLNGFSMQASRLAWVLHYGVNPTGFIDHIDGDRKNNAIGNLRMVTSQENNMNAGLRSHNRLGVRGVREKSGRYQARITKDGKLHNLGWFATIELAQKARIRAENELFADHAYSNRPL